MEELSNYDFWQLEKYGNIVQPVENILPGEEFESGIEELDRLAEWIDLQAQRQLMEYENL